MPEGSNRDSFINGPHGSNACQSCHGGADDRTFETMADAHVDIVRDPSAVGACDACHQAEAAATANSLHTNLWGEKALIEKRGNCVFEGSGYEDRFDQKCAGCHTTCGQCHISRPNSVGGGFPKTFAYMAHKVQKTPHMTEQCTACHGSRIGTDYLGLIEGNTPDTHYSQGMRCEACHSAEEIHGDDQHAGDHYEHRYEVATMPRCETCHDDNDPDFANDYHNAHVNGYLGSANLQCQVCHSQPYKNCTNCHNLVADGKTDKFDIDESVIGLKIAQNPRTDYRGEYNYVVVRHVPVDPNTYEDWGLVLDPTYYDTEPTWKYASPHNIQRWTAQTTSAGFCGGNCHGGGTDNIYLMESDLYEEDGVTVLPDYNANIGIVMDDKKHVEVERR